MKVSLRAWRIAAAAWATAIVVTGVLPTQSAVSAVSGGRDDLATTAGHFAAYALLGFLLGVAVGGWRVAAWTTLSAWVCAVVLGGLVEAVQGPLPYRDAQLVDVVVNAAGAAVGLLLFSGSVLVTRSRSRHG